MKGLQWKLNRLKVMGGRELVHRAARVLQQGQEQIIQYLGKYPKPECPVESNLSLFSHSSTLLNEWEQIFSLDSQGLSLIMEGKIDFFGHSPMFVGNPVNWSSDPVTGVTAPLHYGKTLNYRNRELVGDVKFLWELGRHQHLIPIAVAYAVSGEHRYREFVIRQLEHWCRSNPFGKGIHWCSSLESSLRLISWAFIHSFFTLRDGPEGIFWENPFRKGLGLAIYQQALFIRSHLSRFSSANNHLIGELSGLWIATKVFRWGSESHQWGTFAKAELEEQVELQIYADGVHKEQAVYYHLWVLEYVLLVWLVGKRAEDSFSENFPKKILLMANFLDAVTPTGGTPAPIGDSDDGTVARFDARWPHTPYYDVLSSVSRVFHPNHGEIHEAASTTQKSFWYSKISHSTSPFQTDAISRGKDRKGPILYPDAGYAILKQGALHVIFDAGPLGYTSLAAHGHADALSFCLAVGQDWWIGDPGTFCYHDQEKWRNFFRGTSAHNTATVDHCDQSKIGGDFLWVKHANSYMEECTLDKAGNQTISGWHDGYHCLGVIHRRTLCLKNDGKELSIQDFFDGTGVHAITLHFHFTPTIQVTKSEVAGLWDIHHLQSPYKMTFTSDPNLGWQSIKGDETIPLGWHSTNLGIKEPSYSLKGQGNRILPIIIESRFTIVES